MQGAAWRGRGVFNRNAKPCRLLNIQIRRRNKFFFNRILRSRRGAFPCRIRRYTIIQNLRYPECIDSTREIADFQRYAMLSEIAYSMISKICNPNTIYKNHYANLPRRPVKQSHKRAGSLCKTALSYFARSAGENFSCKTFAWRRNFPYLCRVKKHPVYDPSRFYL